MRKKIDHGTKAVVTKAEKREIKKRPRMHKHGASLKRPSKHGGMAIIKIPKHK